MSETQQIKAGDTVWLVVTAINLHPSEWRVEKVAVKSTLDDGQRLWLMLDKWGVWSCGAGDDFAFLAPESADARLRAALRDHIKDLRNDAIAAESRLRDLKREHGESARRGLLTVTHGLAGAIEAADRD